ncbi:MAG: glutamate--tRNA ligase [Prolixibacteraceae bacterium]|nr:glutamate--tRNA ligase [Prolixibacteraceae bacterium]
MNNQKVRVRFAPSPTGPLHMGGVRTALFNYLFAKKHSGDFILRIEDTDQTRYVPGAEEYIMEALTWCGIKIDEGIKEGGEFGPYRKSDRKAMYKDYAYELIKSGNAYLAFDTSEELDAIRSDYEAKGETFTYNAETRDSLRNSLSMNDEDVQHLIDEGVKYVIRFKMQVNVDVTDVDLIRGSVTFNTDRLDDKVLFKSDGMPTYHLANVVDDHLMQITHVIRGEEWLPSMPLHVLLYEKLGWDKPTFAHLPLILKPVGKGKLSKRDGDKMGFPVFPLKWTDPKTNEVSSGYREDGYFPDAFVNMLAMLGWNPGTEQELFTKEELIAAFDLDRVGKSGSKFDPEKAKWFNHQYMQLRTDKELAAMFSLFLDEKDIDVELEYTTKVVCMLKERATFLPDIWEQGSYFFEAPTEYDAKTVKKRWKEGVPEMMQEIHDFLSSYSDEWVGATVKELFSAFVNEKEWGFGVVMNAFRLCIVGAPMGADLFDICEMIGKEESLLRIQNGIQNIQR